VRLATGRGLPPPWVRLVRNRPVALAAVLAAAIAIAAGGVSEAAHVEVTSQVDAHWRGAYDILVRPRQAHLDLETTADLVEPNFLGFTGIGGITLDQLAAIRALPDVELAAPVAYIGMLETSPVAPKIQISANFDRTTLYRATLTVATSDGIGPRLVHRQVLRVLLGPGSSPARPLVTTDQGGSAGGAKGAVEISTSGFLPTFSSPILAVDAAAERALLGTAGSFLDRLGEVSQGGPYTASTFDPKKVLPDFGDAGIHILSLQKGTAAMRARPVFPVLVSARVYAPLSLSLDVVRLGEPFTESLTKAGALDQIAEAERLAGPGTTPAGTSSRDISADMRPLRLNSVVIPWPGSTEWTGSVRFHDLTTFTAQLTGRPGYVALPGGSADVPQFRIEPQGLVGPGGGAVGASGTDGMVDTGSEQAYRPLTSVPIPIAEGFVSTGFWDAPFILAPVGEYDLDALEPPSDPLTYVPLGAYDPPDTTLVADPLGTPVAPVAMSPTLNPRGLLTVPPLAFTDLAAAIALRGDAPLDAIRVRVAGLAGFDDDARAKVERVATAIAAIGLGVDVVAGSSPQTVRVYVPAYDTSVEPPADLGWVEQHWTTLGAATRVVRGLGETNLALFGLATLALLVVVVGLEILFAAARRRDAAVLAAVGWSRGARARWQVSEALLAGVVVVGLGGAAWSLLGRSPAGLAVVAVIGVAFPAASLLVALAMPANPRAVVATGRGGGVLRRIPTDGLAAYSLRALASRAPRTLVTILALGTATAATGPALALVATVALRVGPTRLAGAVGAQLAPYQLALLGLAAAGSIAFCLVALRVSVADREDELRALAASGWLTSEVAGLLRWDRALVAIPAALLGGLLAFAVSGPLTGGPPLASAAIAAGLALSMVVWGGLVARPALLRGAHARRNTSTNQRGRTQ
jgi:hypothetical protein